MRTADRSRARAADEQPQRQAQASFGGINPAVDRTSFLPAGRSKYTGIHLAYAGAAAEPLRRVRRFDVALAYTLSVIAPTSRSRMAGGIIRDERGGRLQPSASGLLGCFRMDRTHQFTFMPTRNCLWSEVSISLMCVAAAAECVYSQQDGGACGRDLPQRYHGRRTVGTFANTFLETRKILE